MSFRFSLLPLFSALGLAAFVALPAQAQKVNYVYYEDAPMPIGKITPAKIEELASSDFTHVAFAFINFCTIAATKDHCDAPVDPQVVWNIQPVYDTNDAPFADVQAAIKLLKDAGKVVYLSIGAGQNPETWNYFAAATPAQRAASVKQLDRFMKDYGFTGIDLDYEAGSSDGFKALASELTTLSPVPPMSIAPYRTGTTPIDHMSTQWQYCAMLDAGVTPTLINRQNYDGGVTSDVLSVVQSDLKPFDCGDLGGNSGTVSIAVETYNPGLATDNTSPGANCSVAANAPYYAGCTDIATSVVKAYPDIAGMMFWDYDVVARPTSYACEMSNTLNATKKACP